MTSRSRRARPARAASLAVASGAHIKAVQCMLGHASAATTLDAYADLFDNDLYGLFDNDLYGVATRLDDGAARAGVGKVWARATSGA
ncbi:hypothetical protein [Agromyces binzhouensis]|uniref:hypothetical protein n=1 Tax=Agromyces binzhouensis TaxID=1817495 RepID=UPI001A915570